MANISQNVNIEMLEKLPDGTYKKKHPETKASQVKLEDAEGKFTATELEGALSELFTNVSNGKQLVGGAITDVDDSIVIPADPTFQELASKISQIETGKKIATGIIDFQMSDTNSAIEVRGLDFTPYYFIIYKTAVGGYDNASIVVGMMVKSGDIGYFSNGMNAASFAYTNEYDSVRDGSFYSDGVRISLPKPNYSGRYYSGQFKWIAIEG